MNPSEKSTVRVTILGQPYTLRAQGDPKEVEQLAQSVDELMHTIAAKSPNSDSSRVAVLACLHLADKLATLEWQVKHKSEDLAGLLDRALEDE